MLTCLHANFSTPAADLMFGKISVLERICKADGES